MRIGKESQKNIFTYNRENSSFERKKGGTKNKGEEPRGEDFSVEFSNLLNSGNSEANFQLIVYI